MVMSEDSQLSASRQSKANNLNSTVDELADRAHSAAQIEIAGRAMAHPRTPRLYQREFGFF